MSEVEQAVVAGVRDLLPVLRERAQEAEDARDVPAESVKALMETGFFRLLQPATYGGYEADPVTFLTAVRFIASACGSTGWVASVLGAGDAAKRRSARRLRRLGSARAWLRMSHSRSLHASA